MDENTKKTEDKIQELSHQVEELKQSISTNAVSLPIAIIITGVIMAGSIMYTSVSYKNNLTASIKNQIADTVKNSNQAGIPVTLEDHIFGNPNAPVKIVEYSDLECPFCKMFHKTMNQIMNEYGKNGRVAWVYRHFPLDQLHSKARNEARATECAWEQGGNDAFWKFVDKIFEITPSNDGLDPAELPQIAQTIGIDKTKFINCLSSNRNDARIAQNEKDGIASGAQGTPFSIIFTAKGNRLIVNGAQPYENVKKLIDQALTE